MPSPRLRLQLINQQSPTNAAKVAQAPKNPNPNPSRDLSCGSMCNEGDFDEHNDRQRRRRRSTFIMYEVSRRQEFLLRNPEKKPPDDNEPKPMAQNKATPDAAQTSGRGLTKSQGERVRRVECRGTVGTLGDRKNVITANVSMQFWGNVSTDLVLPSLPLHSSPLACLVFFGFPVAFKYKTFSNFGDRQGNCLSKSPKALNAIPSIPHWREETCQSDDDDDDDEVDGGSIHWSRLGWK